MENVGGKQKFFVSPFLANYLTLCLVEEKQRRSTFVLLTYFLNLLFYFLCKQMQSSLEYLFYFFPLVPPSAFALFLPNFKIPLIFIVTDQLSRDKVKVKDLVGVIIGFFSSFCFKYWSLQAGCENNQFSLTIALRLSLSEICNLNCAPLLEDFSIDESMLNDWQNLGKQQNGSIIWSVLISEVLVPQAQMWWSLFLFVSVYISMQH